MMRRAGFLIVVALLLSLPVSAQSPRRRPYSHAVAEFKRLTGHPHGWAGHVVDHRVPLCAGGRDVPDNMQWEEVRESYVKDRFERALCKELKRQGYVLVKKP